MSPVSMNYYRQIITRRRSLEKYISYSLQILNSFYCFRIVNDENNNAGTWVGGWIVLRLFKL